MNIHKNKLYLLLVFLSHTKIVESQINVEFQVAGVNINADLNNLSSNIQSELGKVGIQGTMSNISTLNYTAQYNPCPKGYYCIANLTQEIACPPGTYQPILNATDISKCLN